MTDQHITTNPAPDCDRFHERLMSYLERDLDGDTHTWMDAHHAQCAACADMLHDLDDIVEQASTLPAFAPSRDLWSDIEVRLETPVMPLPAPLMTAMETRSVTPREHPLIRQRTISLRRFAMAATMLVVVTSAITWQVARSDRSGPPTVVVADNGFDDAALLPITNADVVYENEIDALRDIVSERFTELDSTTVVTLQRNLAIIDKAIADCREALEQDPNSQFLNTTLDQALESKLALMRRVALL